MPVCRCDARPHAACRKPGASDATASDMRPR
jgi:hypothetical protein